MKKLSLAFMFVLFGAISSYAQGQAPVQNVPSGGIPDCQIGPITTSTTGRGVIFDNRFLGCTNWTLYEYGNGSVSTVSVELDQAPDAGGVQGTFAVWPAADVGAASVHPITVVTQDQASLFEFAPWISVNVTTLTGAGATVTYTAIGYRPRFNADASANGSTVAGGTVSVQSTVPPQNAVTAELAVNTVSFFSGNPGTQNILGTESFGVDPCLSNGVPKKSVPINIATATTTSLVATSGTTVIYVCSASFTVSQVITTANTLLFEYGTGAACVTTQSVQTGAYGAGGITAAAPVVVEMGEIGPSAAGAALCAVTTIGATGTFQGVLTYVQQ